ncbi:MAG: hypothetical protein MJ188_08690 [Treponema sp.]|nr:hypothetical protein [Treponema sp.]
MNLTADFICFSYKNADYLFEKNVISESLYFPQKNELVLSHQANFRQKEVQIINLDFLVFTLFEDQLVSTENMLMILNKPDITISTTKSTSFKNPVQYLETTAHASVKKIPLQDFKLFGNLMNDYCFKNGILAVRFDESGNNSSSLLKTDKKRIQYLLDINTILETYQLTEQVNHAK